MEDNRNLRKVILYGDVNLDIIDGSAVWLVSMAQVLTLTNSEVHLLLKNKPRRSTLTDSLRTVEGLHVHFPEDKMGRHTVLTPKNVWDHIARIDRQVEADIILVRGRQVALSALPHPRLAKRLWAYITDLPYPITSATKKELNELEELASASRRLFVQTEEARSYIEATVPSAAGKTLLLTPMVPDEFFLDLESARDEALRSHPIRLVYAGKFAPDWRTLEMTQLPQIGAEHGLEVELSIVGDKFQGAGHVHWSEAMRHALEDTPAVLWHGGLSRVESKDQISFADYGLGWRAPALDSSLELSTKALEYAAIGTPPIINRTALHESIFGDDYPLFLEEDSPAEVIRVINIGHENIESTRVRAQNAVRRFSFKKSAERVEQYFQRAEAPIRVVNKERTILIAGHDLKFIGEIAEFLETSSPFSTIYDEWPALNRHDEKVSFEQLQQSDVVLCEWAGHNAIWYSQRVSAGQKLFIRLHGFEATAGWLTNIQIENVDKIIVVSEHLKQQVLDRTGWDSSKVVVVPNSVNIPDLDRPKLPGHQYRIGLVGMVPFLKRPDRAIDVMERLIDRDARFTLHIRGRFPWEYPHVWKREWEQEAYLSFFARIGASPLLQEHIVFETFGPDMGSWLRKIGWILSPSDRESFHLAPVEAMASKAVPIVWERNGARDIFPLDSIVSDTAEAVERICRLSDSESYVVESRKAYHHVSKYDAPKVHAQLLNVLKG